MGQKVIYHLKKPKDGANGYLVPEYSSTGGACTAIRLPDGKFVRISIPDILDQVDKVEELPYDIRKWAPKFQDLWKKSVLSLVSARRSRHQTPVRTPTVETQSLVVNKAAGSLKECIEVQHSFRKQPLNWDEMVGLRGQGPRIKSRRVRQKITFINAIKRSKPGRRGVLTYVGLNVASNLKNVEPLNIPWMDRSKVWPKSLVARSHDYNLRNHVGSKMILAGKGNHLGHSFASWYDTVGKYMDQTFMESLLDEWLQVSKADLVMMVKPTLVQTSKVHYTDEMAYMRGADIKDEEHAPKPITWPLTYKGRLKMPEEVKALRGGANSAGNLFLEWFYSGITEKVACKGHSGTIFNCRDCARIVYKTWNEDTKER
jgi:hypothetical protein